jgi:hypothetical protein
VSAASGEPVWLSILLDMGRNPFYADQQIIPIVNDGTWKAVAEYVSSLRTERDATERLCEQHEGKIHELRDLLAACAQQRDAALHQIKIAKVCNDSQAELIERLTLEKMQRFDEVESLRARLAACEGERDAFASAVSMALTDTPVMRHPNAVVEDARTLRARLAACEGERDAELKRRQFMQVYGRVMGWGFNSVEEMDAEGVAAAGVSVSDEREPYRSRKLVFVRYSEFGGDKARTEAEAIDRAIRITEELDTTDDFGPNDGHARTVNRSAWQEGKV